MSGTAYVLFAYDVGWSVDLDAAERRVSDLTERGSIKRTQRSPQYVEFHPAPVRILQEAPRIPIGDLATAGSVEALLYDFGALSLKYRIPLAPEFSRLLELSELLYENEALRADARARVEQLVTLIRPAVERPAVSEAVEDYVIYHLESAEPWLSVPRWKEHSQELAQVLRCSRMPLSPQEVEDALSHVISFGVSDLTVIDWNASILLGPEMEDVQSVLEFANVELLESRLMDGQLDDALDQAYEMLTRNRWRLGLLPGAFRADSAHVAELQVDSAMLFERVSNTLKLIGDQFLSRVYLLAAERFHLPTWDAAILRKLQTLDSIYQKMSDRAATWRMELLEWIIILLIAVSIVLPFFLGTSKP